MTQQTRLTLAAVLAVLLSAACLDPLLDGAGWVVPVAVTALAVGFAAQAVRRSSLPRALAPIVAGIVLLLALTVLFAREPAWGSVIPTPAAVAALRDLFQLGVDDINAYAPPLTPSTGLTLLLTASLGLATIVVDTVAVTLRRPALAGLPLLGLYTVPAALAPAGVPWHGFALAALGYLVLLLSDARDKVLRWGRPLVGSLSGRDAAGALGATGRRVGVAAVGVAVLVPVAAPALDDGLLRGGSGSGFFGSGGSKNRVEVVNPIVDLGRDLNLPAPVEVFTYRSSSSRPGYVRLASLDSFDGQEWGPRSIRVPSDQTVDKGLRPPPGLGTGVDTEPVVTDLELTGLTTKWLPLPFPAQRVEGLDGRWLWDETTFNVWSAESAQGQDYRVHSVDVRPTVEQLRAAGAYPSDLRDFVELPDDVPPEIPALAVSLTSDLPDDSDFDKVATLQAYLRSPANFSYDEEAPGGSGLDSLAAFLRNRSGYCVHFSSALAVMARSLDIPARVVVGWTPGEELDDGSYLVTTDAMHAWTEIYFDGVGWVAFEPTPARRTGQPPSYTQVPSDTPQVPGVVPTAPSSTGAPVQGRPRDDVGAGAAAGDGGGGGLLGGTDVPWTGVTASLGVVALAAVPWATRAGTRRRRWAAASTPAGVAAAAWDELRDSAVDHGFEVPASSTPRQVTALLSGWMAFAPPTSAALDRVARAAERAHYAPSVGEVGDLRADVTTVVDAIADRRSRLQRVHARLLPASVVRRASAAVGDVSASTSTAVADWQSGWSRRFRALTRPGALARR